MSLTMVKPGTERNRGPQAGGRRGGGPGGEHREGQPGQPAGGRADGNPRPARSALTAPPVGAPSVAVLPEASAATARPAAIGPGRGATLGTTASGAAIRRPGSGIPRITIAAGRFGRRAASEPGRPARPDARAERRPAATAGPRAGRPAAKPSPAPPGCAAAPAVQGGPRGQRAATDLRSAQTTVGSPHRRARRCQRPFDSTRRRGASGSGSTGRRTSDFCR